MADEGSGQDVPEVDAREIWRAALGRALGYVEQRGTAFEKLRARALCGQVPGRDVRAALADAGTLDGEDAEPLLAAFEALDPVGGLAGGEVERAVARLASTVGEDGSFGREDEPLEARIVRTGMLGGYLTKSLMLRPRIRDAIDGFLSRSWDPDRVKTGAWEPIAAYAHWFSLNDSELSDPILQWCGRELERGFRTRQFDAVTTSRTYVLCDAVALPGASLSVPDLCEGIAAEQTEEGGFALSARALAGEPVAAALDAIAAFVRIGRVA